MGPLLILLGAITWTIAWQLPGHYVPWLTFQQEFAAAIGAILFAMAAIVPRRSPVRWPLIALVMMATAVVPIVQFALGQILYITDAVLATAYLVGFALCITAGATLVKNHRSDFLDALSLAFLFGAIASAGLALAQWLGAISSVMVEVTEANRPFANLSQPNNLATLLWLGISGLVRLYMVRKVRAFSTILALAFLGWGLVLTQSRTAWLFAVVLAAWLLWARRRAALPINPKTILIALALFGVCVVVLPHIAEQLMLAQPQTLVQRATGGSGTRWIYWQTFVDAVARSPLWGYGWTQTVLAQQAVVLDHSYTGHYVTYSHNLLIDLLVWNGLPIGLLLIAVLAWWCVRQVRQCRSVDQVTLVAAFGAFLLHAMLEFPFAYAFFLLPIGLVMGALDGLDGTAPQWQLRKLTLAAPLAAMTVFTAFLGIEYFKLEQQTRTMRFAVAGYKVKGAQTSDLSRAGAVMMQKQLDFNRFVLLDAGLPRSSAELDWAWNVARRTPMAPLQMRFAIMAGLNGRAVQASTALALLCRMGPPENCITARNSWTALQARYPSLQAIAPPDMPPGHVHEAP
jgi:hypothetical protein